MTLPGTRRWFRRVDGHRTGPLGPADDSASLVVDDFAFVLYVGPAELSGVHDGDEFRAVAAAGRVDVYVVDGIDPRRARPDDFSEAASAGRLVAGAVRAYPVTTVNTRS